ncbi:MAG: hypothetical protein VX519_02240 [Myxococcota bacterium]|nr:hypothetical protein [Myxococcota bacterium]
MNTPPTQTGMARIKEWAITLVVLTATAVLITVKVWPEGTKHIIGDAAPMDLPGTAWLYWWVGHALSHGLNPFEGSWNFHPVGVAPLAQYNLLDALVASPLFLWFSPVLAYNLTVVFFLVASGCGLALLCRTAGTSHSSARIAGIALMTSSFLAYEISDGRLAQALLAFWFVSLAGVFEILKGRGTWVTVLWTGLTAAATSLTYWYYGLFLGFAGLVLLAVHAREVSRSQVIKLCTAAAIPLVVCAPFILELAGRFDHLPGVNRSPETWMKNVKQGRGEFGLANVIHLSHWPLWPLWKEDPLRPKLVSIGVLVFAAWACKSRVTHFKTWLGLAFTGWVLTLGPYLRFQGEEATFIPLPYLLLYDWIPYFDRFWWPQRLEFVFLTGILILAGLQIDALSKRGRWVPFAALAFVLIDIPLRNEYLPLNAEAPLDSHDRVYQGLDGALLTTPVTSGHDSSRHLLWLQTLHERPILAGDGDHIPSHWPVGYQAYIESRPILTALQELSLGTFTGLQVQPEHVTQLLNDGYEYAIVDPSAYVLELRLQWASTFSEFFNSLWGEPVRVSDRAAAWRIRPIEESRWLYVPFNYTPRTRPRVK